MTYIEDALVEQPAIKLFTDLGWDTLNCWEETFGENSLLGRENRDDAELVNRLHTALEKVILPPKELCSDFGEFTKPIEVQKYKFECQINKLKQQRDMLFPKLISGAIQIKHTYGVVA
jgi:hypothetical protein